MTVLAVWLADLNRSTIELRIRVAVDLTAEQFAFSDQWSASDGYALEWRLETQTRLCNLDPYAGTYTLNFCNFTAGT
jgi:hypothetical protein